MKICLFTVSSPEYAEIATITLPVMQKYCQRHGYAMELGAYHTNPNSLVDYGDRSKLRLYDKFFNDYDAMMFLDVDALIMNHDIKIEDVLCGRPFLWTYDANGPCSGFWIAQCVQPVRHALITVSNRAPLLGNVRTLEHLGPPHKITLEMEPRGQSDQETMRAMMHEPPFNKVLGHCVSGKEAGHCYDYPEIGWPEEWQYINHYTPGDWIVTFPSLSLERRVELLRRYASHE